MKIIIIIIQLNTKYNTHQPVQFSVQILGLLGLFGVNESQ